MSFDTLIIGAGHNGLVAAAVLAKAGLKSLVLERAERVGGCAATTELGAGFRCPTFAHRARLDPNIIRDLELTAHGLQPLRSRALACAPTTNGQALVLWADTTAASREIAAFSADDARRYPEFVRSIAAASRVVRRVMESPAPDLDHPAPADVVRLLKTARAFRGLGKADAYRLLRWLPMAVSDFTAEWFESEPLRATIAADGLLGMFLGPRSAGSTAALLVQGAGEGRAIAPGWNVRGGVGALADALAAAARKAGAEIRTASTVQSITVHDDTATGVVLSDGEEIAATRVISSLDPRRTLLSLTAPLHLSPAFARRVRNIRMRGALAKVNFALSALPVFTALNNRTADEQRAALSGCIRLAPLLDLIEHAFDAAKYGRCPDEPWIELAIPSVDDDSLAPSGCHVASAYVQFIPYALENGTWDEERDKLGDVVTRTIAKYAPGFERLILARQVLTPRDLERDLGLTGGHIYQGELALDQLFVARPFLGWPGYRTPIRGLFLCGSGVHPGTGLDGRSGLLAARAILKAGST